MLKGLMKLFGWGGRDYSYLESPEYREKCKLAAQRRRAREKQQKEAERKRQASLKMKRAWTLERREAARKRMHEMRDKGLLGGKPKEPAIYPAGARFA